MQTLTIDLNEEEVENLLLAIRDRIIYLEEFATEQKHIDEMDTLYAKFDNLINKE